ncbi:MAG TPA: methyltransferase domain-containing protein [Sphingomicrobium sp.]|nr:methyltransferase domain-containing protein [Sphingomicrobium sp.]
MSATDTGFAGSIPALYDGYLGPLLFEPFAEEVARRARVSSPGQVLETAAGTGIVTAALQRGLPDAHIVATDLNQAMLDLAAQRIRSDRVSFEAMDAQELRFVDEMFDLVVCQFGVMFYSDRVRGNAEARRVLRDDGRYLLVLWDALDRNPVPHAVHQAVTSLFPDDPPAFLARTPFGYGAPEQIEADLRAADFSEIEFETVTLHSKPISARDAAIGLCQGTPLRAEIEPRGAQALERATAAAAEALRRFEQDGRIIAPMSAHVVTAIR